MSLCLDLNFSLNKTFILLLSSINIRFTALFQLIACIVLKDKSTLTKQFLLFQTSISDVFRVFFYKS